MKTLRGSRHFLDTVPYTASTRVSRELQVPDRFITRLFVWLRATLTVSGGTTDGALHADGPANLIQTLELLVNGETVKHGSGASFLRMAQNYDGSVGVNSGLTAASAATYTLEALIPIMFAAPGSVSPLDTLLDGRFVKNMTLNVTFGSDANLVIGGDRTSDLSAVTCDVYMLSTEPFPGGPFWMFKEIETTQTGILTSTATRIIVPFNPGSIVRAIQVRTIDATNLSDAIINSLNLRINGQDTPWADLEDDFMQAMAVHEFGIAQPTGYYHLEIPEAGRVMTTGLGATEGVAINSVDLVCDTTVGAGATSVVLHVVEYVPPDVHRLAAAGS